MITRHLVGEVRSTKSTKEFGPPWWGNERGITDACIIFCFARYGRTLCSLPYSAKSGVLDFSQSHRVRRNCPHLEWILTVCRSAACWLRENVFPEADRKLREVGSSRRNAAPRNSEERALHPTVNEKQVKGAQQSNTRKFVTFERLMPHENDAQ